MKYKSRTTYIYNPSRNITLFCKDHWFNEQLFLFRFKNKHPTFIFNNDHLYLKWPTRQVEKLDRKIQRKKKMLTAFMWAYATEMKNLQQFINNNY